MKRFRSRWTLLQRLARQQEVLAQLQVMAARQRSVQAHEQQAQAEQAVCQQQSALASQLHAPHSAVAWHSGLACLQELGQVVESSRQSVLIAEADLVKAIQSWQGRQMQVDQTDRLMAQARSQYQFEAQRTEQITLEEQAQQARRTTAAREDLGRKT